jgi:hypothetical protein
MKNLSKVINLILVVLTLSLTACKKETTEETGPANYNDMTKADIEAVANTMSNSTIEATNANGHVLKVGDVIVYKTKNNRYGKMEILAIDDASNYKLTIKAVTYNTSDDGIFSATASAEVRGTWLCDLDNITETDLNADADFKWDRLTATDTNLRPYNTAVFAIFNF